MMEYRILKKKEAYINGEVMYKHDDVKEAMNVLMEYIGAFQLIRGKLSPNTIAGKVINTFPDLFPIEGNKEVRDKCECQH